MSSLVVGNPLWSHVSGAETKDWCQTANFVLDKEQEGHYAFARLVASFAVLCITYFASKWLGDGADVTVGLVLAVEVLPRIAAILSGVLHIVFDWLREKWNKEPQRDGRA